MNSRRKTPLRTFTCDDEIWLPALAEAERRGETVSEALRRFLVRYGKRR